MKIEAKVVLRISHFDFNPSEISNHIQIDGAPEVFMSRIGDKIKSHGVVGHNFWGCESKCYDNVSFRSKIDEYIDVISKNTFLNENSHDLSIELGLVIYIYDDPNIGFNVSLEQIGVLNRVGASLDVDVYCLRE